MVERYKAYLVAKEYTQREGLDYLKAFSPVAKMVTIHCLRALVAINGWFSHQLDVNNILLYGDLAKKIYMTLSTNFGNKGESRVC